ncbi:MAG TPA: His/Gly/Thr/Pro-type tRNA ligase C-terminal domain-containing protein, partial [bacterium]|nr:His/Gly/Thr/Pro-type tRNA ligase C-terminal domain-containing protein [bacterium]
IPLAGRLRKKGISCGILWGEGSLKSKMRKAGESSKKVIILGESEIKEGVITLKDLEKSEEKKIKEEEIENESHWI